MTPEEKVRAVLALHTPTSTPSGLVCEHCAELCHSWEGLRCDDPDGAYPCDTVRAINGQEART